MFLRRLLPKLLKTTRTLPPKPLNQACLCSVNVTKPKMAENMYNGVLLNEIVEGLENFAATKLAEDWDNVGLLVDPIEQVPIRRILLTNDLTEKVVEEAVDLQAKFIVSYHPNILKGLKSVSSRTWKERVVVNCIKNNIAVFSPHTSWDSVQGGINDWLADVFPKDSERKILLPKADNQLVGPGRLVTLNKPIVITDVIDQVKTHIGIPHLRLALAKGKNEESEISSVALCAGSGSSVLRDVQADLYLTGEMLHHDILDAAQRGIHVILCNHSDSERGFLKVFQNILQEDILQNRVEVVMSKFDCDPLKTV